MLRFHLTSEKGLFTSQNQADDNCKFVTCRHLFVWNIGGNVGVLAFGMGY